MAHIIVWHQVEDFEIWKNMFDEHEATRRAAGSQGGTVYRSSDDSNEIVVVLRWDNQDNARAFMESQNLQEVMAAAGVTGQPMVAFLDDGEPVPA